MIGTIYARCWPFKENARHIITSHFIIDEVFLVPACITLIDYPRTTREINVRASAVRTETVSFYTQKKTPHPAPKKNPKPPEIMKTTRQKQTNKQTNNPTKARARRTAAHPGNKGRRREYAWRVQRAEWCCRVSAG